MIDYYLKPRFTILTAPLFVQLIGLICVAASLITIPLGLFPFGPVLPGLTILLFGLGLTARDGVLLEPPCKQRQVCHDLCFGVL